MQTISVVPSNTGSGNSSNSPVTAVQVQNPEQVGCFHKQNRLSAISFVMFILFSISGAKVSIVACLSLWVKIFRINRKYNETAKGRTNMKSQINTSYPKELEVQNSL